MRFKQTVALALLGACLPSLLQAEALVAVATNFADAIQRLETDFETTTNHRITVTTGSTGKLYAQILHGAPFDVFLAADQQRPQLLADRGPRFTYAIGRLALWSPSPNPEQALRDGSFRRLAIANPKLAPYGVGAREALAALGVEADRKLAVAENVGQTYAFVATGAADLGFVALSTALRAKGHYWEVPQDLYNPIRQDAVQLRKTPAAEAFMTYLESDRAKEIIRGFGYGVE